MLDASSIMGAFQVILQGFATPMKKKIDKLKNSLFRVGEKKL